MWNPMSIVAAGRKHKGGESKLTKGPKKKQPRYPTWTHSFVCLSETTQEIVPDTDNRAKLLMAGLGEKRLQLRMDADAQSIYFELCSAFPKLSDAGGYEFLRAQEGGGKLLSPIVLPPNGYSTNYLKAVVHSAKIYIRPLQRDLSLEPVENEA